MTDTPNIPDVGTKVLLRYGPSETPFATPVLAKCDQNVGHWLCVTHDYAPANNWGLWSHYGKDAATHTVVWICHEHGPEQP